VLKHRAYVALDETGVGHILVGDGRVERHPDHVGFGDRGS
jgi:hypothetical protein